MAGCSGPISAYHDIEGGAIAEARQPPPGADLPYPNLASVPPAPAAVTPEQQQATATRLPAGGTTPPDSSALQASPAALAGLALPQTPPPAPDVPGLSLPQAPQAITSPAPAIAQAAAPPAAKPPDGVPVSLAFAPGSAIIDTAAAKALTEMALAKGNALILAGGFGEQTSAPDEAALSLALNRARAIADALTAAGVPPGQIRLVAAAAGSGGFAQLVY